MKKNFNQVINLGYVINYLLIKIKQVRDHDHITGNIEVLLIQIVLLTLYWQKNSCNMSSFKRLWWSLSYARN